MSAFTTLLKEEQMQVKVFIGFQNMLVTLYLQNNFENNLT